MEPPRRTSIQKSSLDASCDVLLKHDRIARFAPEKQFSTTFRHRQPKLKRFDSAHLHQWFRHIIYIVLTCSALASLILLLVGILWDCRSCLTAGCILGLACFGAMLHGCLRHRSLPSTPTPLVLSAAYMCPVGNLPIGTNPETTAAATAMATATLLPKTMHSNPTLMASSLEVAMLAQLRRDVSIAFPPGSYISSSHSMRRSSFLKDAPTDALRQGYKRQLSDSVAYTRSSGRSGESDNTIQEFQTQFSCPARTGALETKPHVYENLICHLGRKFSETQTRRSSGKDVSAVTCKTGRDSSQSASDAPPASQNHGSQKSSDQHTPQPGSVAFYNPPVFPVAEAVPTITDVPTGSSTNEQTSVNSLCTGSGTESLTSVRPNLFLTHGTAHVRVISPKKSPIQTPRSVLEAVNRDARLDTNVSTGLIGLLSDSTAHSYGGIGQSRRHNREREGVFGPKIWRAWRSWVD